MSLIKTKLEYCVEHSSLCSTGRSFVMIMEAARVSSRFITGNNCRCFYSTKSSWSHVRKQTNNVNESETHGACCLRLLTWPKRGTPSDSPTATVVLASSTTATQLIRVFLCLLQLFRLTSAENVAMWLPKRSFSVKTSLSRRLSENRLAWRNSVQRGLAEKKARLNIFG